ncbi:hypothetical protein [Tychonema sp. LEGE 07203]|uniref:hypothetical protein n=1 Tax=Tychonema sp. LEGE 07203 TaxID=1828671 RepID=UPI0018822CC0|nr:hypothetical protein [Tychonema sp. LEGE 07203]MBE9094940.1 hypothetical protein [Tychonema sp. LEGE 07203]
MYWYARSHFQMLVGDRTGNRYLGFLPKYLLAILLGEFKNPVSVFGCDRQLNPAKQPISKSSRPSESPKPRNLDA